MEMKDIFVYGTLLNDEVLKILFGSTLTKYRARLPGYKRVKVRGEPYPAIRADGSSGVDGALITGLSSDDLIRLDQYEGRYYKRESVVVYINGNVPQHCQTYVFRPQYYEFLSSEAWCNKSFRKEHMQFFLSGLVVQN